MFVDFSSAISIALAASELGIASQALAQTEDDDAQGEVEEIIVTGSRIAKDVFTASDGSSRRRAWRSPCS